MAKHQFQTEVGQLLHFNDTLFYIQIKRFL